MSKNRLHWCLAYCNLLPSRYLVLSHIALSPLLASDSNIRWLQKRPHLLPFFSQRKVKVICLLYLHVLLLCEKQTETLLYISNRPLLEIPRRGKFYQGPVLKHTSDMFHVLTTKTFIKRPRLYESHTFELRMKT